jgi:hypothetical protein
VWHFPVRDSDARFPFTIKVIDSEEANAFALPGGFLYVHSGLILLVDVWLTPNSRWQVGLVEILRDQKKLNYEDFQ